MRAFKLDYFKAELQNLFLIIRDPLIYYGKICRAYILAKNDPKHSEVPLKLKWKSLTLKNCFRSIILKGRVSTRSTDVHISGYKMHFRRILYILKK